MIIKAPINLDLTINSGQTSQPPWRLNEDTFSNVVTVDGKPLVFKVKQSGEYLDFNLNDEKAVSKLRYIFDLDYDLSKFYRYLDNQPCSANNSIKRWTKSVSLIKQKWGKQHMDYYMFPQSNVLAKAYLDGEEEFNLSDIKDIGSCENNLKNCGVGYRAPYMRRASELFTLEMDLSEIFKMDYDEAFETILEVPGIGPKVADCILLYGFNFREAFPSDVWIKRIVSHLYFDGKDISVSKVREFGMEEFGKNAGYVQLYMFHYARMSGLMSKLKK